MAIFNKFTIDVFNSIDSAIVVFSQTKIILHVNNKFEDIFSCITEDVINLEIDYLFKKKEFINFDDKKSKIITINNLPYKVFTTLKELDFNNEKLNILTITEQKNNFFQDDKFDFMTGALSKKSLENEISEQIINSKKDRDRLIIIAIRLYKIGSINNYAGYDVGDALINESVKRLKKLLPKNSKIGRTAGNKFTVTYSISGIAESPALMCKQIISQLSKVIIINDIELNLSVNIGLAFFPQDGADAIKILDASDKALEAVIENGQNKFKFFNADISRRIDRLNLIDINLPNAIANELFSLCYQPIVSLEDNKIVSAEVLLRWNSSKLGEVSPSEFIPRAEAIGVIYQLGQWVLEQACFEAKIWANIIEKPIKIGVNFSAIQLADENIVEDVSKILEDANLSPSLLDIELTEHSLVIDPINTVKSINALKAMGITFSLDDFGTGYSSLSQLSSYPIDTLKIDQSFIVNLLNSKDSLAIVKAISQMSNELELSLLAEGVENERQIDLLSSLGCSLAQGHYFYKALTKEKFREILKNE